jgi:hypothetical protein
MFVLSANVNEFIHDYKLITCGDFRDEKDNLEKIGEVLTGHYYGFSERHNTTMCKDGVSDSTQVYIWDIQEDYNNIIVVLGTFNMVFTFLQLGLNLWQFTGIGMIFFSRFWNNIEILFMALNFWLASMQISVQTENDNNIQT